MFTSKPGKYRHNVIEASLYNAQPARLGVTETEHVPAVLIRNGAFIAAVMPIPEALRLANQIADAVQAHNRR